MHLIPSLRASSPIWASEASLARTRERAAKPQGSFPRPPRSRVLARLTSHTQIGELARRLLIPYEFLVMILTVNSSKDVSKPIF